VKFIGSQMSQIFADLFICVNPRNLREIYWLADVADFRGSLYLRQSAQSA
jgi:hypothetical protein